MIDFPPTSERYRQIHTTLNYFETVGTLHKDGLINEQLLFDWLAVEAVWDRVKSLAIGDREQYGIPCPVGELRGHGQGSGRTGPIAAC